MPEWSQILAEEGPKIALAFLAAKQGGPMAVSGLLEGLTLAAERRQAAARQQQLDQAAAEQAAFSRQRAILQEGRAEAALGLQEEQAERARFKDFYDQFQQVLERSAETAPDLTTALSQAAVQGTGLAEAYRLPQGTGAPFLAGMSTRRQGMLKRRAKEIVAAFEKQAAQAKTTPDQFIYQGPEWDQPKRYQELRDIVEGPIRTPEGLPPPVAVGGKEVTPGSFEDYLSATPARQAQIASARAAYAAAGREPDKPPDPSLAALRELNLELAKLRLAEGEKRAALGKGLPPEYRNALDRALVLAPTQRRLDVIALAERLGDEGKIDQVAGLIRQAAIERADVTTQRQVTQRDNTMAALREILATLRELDAAGVKTNIARGTLEDFARSLGTSTDLRRRTLGTETDARLVTLGNRIDDTLVEYRHALTGVQFGQREESTYRRMFPNYRNTLPVNVGLIEGLLRGMGARNDAFYRRRLGDDGAALIRRAETPGTLDPQGLMVGEFEVVER